MIISDTHSYDFEQQQNTNFPFQHPLPKTDVLLHCGDLTMRGRVEELQGVIKMLGSIEAELKLVIAGNHDLTLDEPYWRRLSGKAEARKDGNGDSDESDDSDDNDVFEDHARAVEIMTGQQAVEAGVAYLEEGIHKFTLKNGAKFTLYASSYQPEFCGYAFPYSRKEDRYNPPEFVADGVRSIDGVKVPESPEIDIMMTHGPPKGIMDLVYQARMTAHVGCDALMTAVSRARPLLYCFGHIHEGYGAELISWSDENRGLGNKSIVTRSQQTGSFPEPLSIGIKPGEDTLMVNAAIRDVRYRPVNAPWLVDLDLPVAE
jgi:Icc-related predicted phosphoesterase